MNELPGSDASGPQIWNRSQTVPTHPSGKIAPRRHAVPNRRPPALHRFVQFAAQLRCRRRKAASGGPAAAAPPSPSLWQTVTVRASRSVSAKVKAGAWAAFGRYLERPGANRDRIGFNDQFLVSLEPTLEHWQRSGDLYLYKVVLAPREDVSDLKAYTCAVVRLMEEDLGRRLEWAAAVHTNTRQAHVHLVIRSRALDGRPLTISKHYLYRELRSRAREQATTELGYRRPGARQTTERPHGPELAREPARARQRQQKGRSR